MNAQVTALRGPDGSKQVQVNLQIGPMACSFVLPAQGARQLADKILEEATGVTVVRGNGA